MNLYLLSQSEQNGYGTYDSCVVAAKSEEKARKIHPSGDNTDFRGEGKNWYGAWAATPEGVTVELIGKAVKGTESGVICSSFNAG